MICKNLVIRSVYELHDYLKENELKKLAKGANSILVQIYTANVDADWIKQVISSLVVELPQGIIVGATSVGEISDGQLFLETTVVSFAFFDKTDISLFNIDVTDINEFQAGKVLRQEIELNCLNIDGVLLLSTPLSIDVSNFLTGFSRENTPFPIFGGGASDYVQMKQSLVFCNDQCFSRGAVAVVFSGNAIDISTYTYLGWQELSKKMTVTSADGLWVKSVDNKPAFDIYKRYLGIENDENFFLNVVEFPFLILRDGKHYARIPVSVNSEKALQFIADIKLGETFRIGYGNPMYIIDQASNIQNQLNDFGPDAVFLYSCGSRRVLLQNDVSLETEPFELIAPTFGFYTYGEFIGDSKGVNHLNSTMVVVGMKEHNTRNEKLSTKFSQAMETKEEIHDPYALRHSKLISRLVSFIKASSDELEEASKEAAVLAETYYLTQTFNRRKASELLVNEVENTYRTKSEFSVILLDLDYFKRINDTYGHGTGDNVLENLVKTIKALLRATDMLSRWGGEEFLIILPGTNLKGAFKAAEKIRLNVELTVFNNDIHLTCSFGVTFYKAGELIETLIERADVALYEAKSKGRNIVVCNG